MTNTRFGDWMETYSGRTFYPLDARPEEVYIEDIAHALSMMCRFNGHCTHFYSVAEHSIHTSYLVPEPYQMQAHMHDSTEAFLADIIRPVKPFLKGYSEFEHALWLVIAKRFDIDPVMHETVKKADNAILLTEKNHLKPKEALPWNISGEPADREIWCLSPAEAKKMFLDRFVELGGVI